MAAWENCSLAGTDCSFLLDINAASPVIEKDVVPMQDPAYWAVSFMHTSGMHPFSNTGPDTPVGAVCGPQARE